MPREIQSGEATASRRRIYFQVCGTDGITPATGEAGGQPQISTDGAAWTNTGIGTLTAVGNGRYYADLTTLAVTTAGVLIETRYKSAGTAECPGDSVLVVEYDPVSSIAEIEAKTAAIGTATVTWSSPLSADGSFLEITRGDDYYAVDGRAIDFSITGWADITGGTVGLYLQGTSIQNMSIISSGGSPQIIRLEMSSTVTAALQPGEARYQILATLLGGHKVTPVFVRINAI